MKIRIVPVAAGVAAAAGIAITGASLASAANTTAAPAAYSAAATPGVTGETPAAAPPNSNGNTDPTKPMRSDEHLLTGDVAARVTAAAKAKEPKATIQRVETDSDGVYEAHMVRADGTPIIVQIGKDFAVTNVQVGGPGAPGGHGAPPATGSSTAPTS